MNKFVIGGSTILGLGLLGRSIIRTEYVQVRLGQYHWNLQQKMEKRSHDKAASHLKKHINVVPLWYDESLVDEAVCERIEKKYNHAPTEYGIYGTQMILFPKDIGYTVGRNSVMCAAKNLAITEKMNFIYYSFPIVEQNSEHLKEIFEKKLGIDQGSHCGDNTLTDIINSYELEENSLIKDRNMLCRKNLESKEVFRNKTLVIFDNVENVEKHPEFKGFFYSIIIEAANRALIKPLVLTKDPKVTERLIGINGGGKTSHLIFKDQEPIIVSTSSYDHEFVPDGWFDKLKKKRELKKSKEI